MPQITSTLQRQKPNAGQRQKVTGALFDLVFARIGPGFLTDLAAACEPGAAIHPSLRPGNLHADLFEPHRTRHGHLQMTPHLAASAKAFLRKIASQK